MEESTQEEVQQDAPQVEEPVVAAEPVVSDDVDAEKNKGMAILAYFIFFIPMLTDAKNSKFAMFHANQSLILTIGFVAMMFISMGIITMILTFPISVALFVFWIMGLINAAGGEMKELPLIGGIHILDKK
jgi:uncharacterized membrane protein